MRIGMDFDETTMNYLDPFCKYHNLTYGTSISRTDVFTYNLWEVLGISKEEAVKRVYDFQKSHHFSGLEPIEGAGEVIRALAKTHELFVITSRANDFIEETRISSERHFPNIFSGRIYHTNKYPSNKGKSQRKLDICLELKIKLLIEDNLEEAVECASEGIIVLLKDSPWNKDYKISEFKKFSSWLEVPGIARFYSWLEVLGKI